MKFVNRPCIELEEEKLILIDATIELFGNIAKEAHNEGPIFKSIEFEADKMVEYLSDFIDLYVKEI